VTKDTQAQRIKDMFIRTPGYCRYRKRQEVSGCRTLGMLKL